ncbi:MAG: hypothetical protein AAFZ17_22660 [Cyanobacteria bacterium J06650_10]
MQAQNNAPQPQQATEVIPSRNEIPVVNQPATGYEPVFFLLTIMAFLAFLKAYSRN